MECGLLGGLPLRSRCQDGKKIIKLKKFKILSFPLILQLSLISCEPALFGPGPKTNRTQDDVAIHYGLLGQSSFHKKNNVEALCITHNPKKAFVSRSNSRLTTTETTDDVCGEIGSRVRSPESRHQRESEHTPGFWDCLLSVRELCDKHGKLLNTFGGGKDTALIGTSKLRMGGFEG